MRFLLPLLSLLLLATAAPAEEPAQSEAPLSPDALAALESRLGVVQEHLEHELTATIERSMQKTLAKRFNDGFVRHATPPAAPAPVPARRAPVSASEQAESSPMRCTMVNGTMECRLLASRGSR